MKGLFSWTNPLLHGQKIILWYFHRHTDASSHKRTCTSAHTHKAKGNHELTCRYARFSEGRCSKAHQHLWMLEKWNT